MMRRTAAVEVLRAASGQLQLAVDHAMPGRAGIDEAHADLRVEPGAAGVGVQHHVVGCMSC
jgi:hypothetical protein